jgi:hypothetical protein
LSGVSHLRVDQIADAVDREQVNLLNPTRTLCGNANLDVRLLEYAADFSTVATRESDDRHGLRMRCGDGADDVLGLTGSRNGE